MDEKAIQDSQEPAVYQGSIKVETLEIEIPESCTYCGFRNMKIYGHRVRGRTMAEVRCMRCGKKLTLIEKDE